MATVTYPNGVATQFSYDQLNRVSGLAASSQSAEVSGYTYHRDETGKLTSALELDNRNSTWNYDGVYRLNGETITNAPGNKNGTVSYTLDPVGNRTSDSSSISGLSPVSGTYNADDQLSGETYDSNGNVTATGGKTFTYDSQNELVSMNGTVSIVYDGDGNRVAKTVNGVTTKYLVDDLNPAGVPKNRSSFLGWGRAILRSWKSSAQVLSRGSTRTACSASVRRSPSAAPGRRASTATTGVPADRSSSVGWRTAAAVCVS